MHLWNELYRRREGKEGQQLWPEPLPKAIELRPTKDYVDRVLAGQVELRAHKKDFLPKDQLPRDWAAGPYGKTMEADKAPSTAFQQLRKRTA